MSGPCLPLHGCGDPGGSFRARFPMPRMPAATTAELIDRGHRVQTHSRWASGDAPVMIRVLPDGVIEAGADPYGYRIAHAW